MTQSGIKTHSSMEGSDDNFNEIRFEDKKDSEEIYIHAEKDLNCVIENNETRKVGFEDKDAGDQEIEIYNDQKLTAGYGSRAGSQIVKIFKDRNVELQSGNDALMIYQGNMSVQLKEGNQTTKLDLGKSATEAMQSIELKVGANSIKIDQSGITIKGLKITVEGSAMVEVKAPMTKVDASGMLSLTGGVIKIN